MRLLNPPNAQNGRTDLSLLGLTARPKGKILVSKSDTPTGGLTTEEFEAALTNLLRIADRNDVDTPRSLDVSGGVEGTEWMVEITKIERGR